MVEKCLRPTYRFHIVGNKEHGEGSNGWHNAVEVDGIRWLLVICICISRNLNIRAQHIEILKLYDEFVMARQMLGR